ncbi:hypothetical protein [Pseudomonas sp. TE3610]
MKWHEGLEVHALGFLSFWRSSAARAALPEVPSVPHFVATYHGLWDRRCPPWVFVIQTE